MCSSDLKFAHGEPPWANLDALHRASFDALVEKFGLGSLSEADRRHCALAWHALEPWPDVRGGMGRLHARFVLAPLSNGNVSLLIDLARHAQLPFDAILSAELFRHYKPDPEVYRGAVELLGCAPAEVALVAAHNGDLQAAAACGLRTIFVARPAEYGPRQRQDFSAADGVDIAVRDLEELADKLC